MGYVSTMMECSAHVYRSNPRFDNRRGIEPQFFPVDTVDGGLAANRLEPDPIPCNVQQASPRTIMLYGQQNAEFSTVLIFDRDPRCQQNDQIRVKDRTGATTYYRAVGAARPVGRGRQWVVAADFIEHPLYP